MEKEVSRFKNNSLASKKKHIYSRLLDYFLTFVITYIFFVVFYSISGSVPAIVDISVELSGSTQNLINYVDSTHLQSKDENNDLISIEDGANTYLIGVAKTSAYVNNMKYPYKQSDGTFIEKDVPKEETFISELQSYKLDNLSYYYKIFKKSEPSINNYVYEGVDYQNDIDTLLYSKLMTLDDTKFIDTLSENYINRAEGASKYVILNAENTNYLIKRMAMGESSTVVMAITNHLGNGYVKAVQHGISEVENVAAPYLNYLGAFNKAYQKLAGAILIVYLLAYSTGFILITVIGRLVGKRWITVGQKVMNLAIADLEECEPHPARLVLYNGLNYILFISSSLIGLLLMGSLGVTAIEIFPHFPVIAILLAVLTFNLISLFLPLFTKNRYDISTFVSRLVLKDVNEFDVPVTDEIPDEQQEKEENHE
ncbi:MAG: hypothetical protein K5925_00560 [Bacilli bacterium]|nr:hypothetical protein [Bacilli bacterium]